MIKNWNPTFSPVWKWFRDHGLAVVMMVAAKPDIFGNVSHDAGMVAGILTAVAAIVGANLPHAPEK